MRRLMGFADLGLTTPFAYHYTRASTALEHVLPSMTLRLGLIGDTNDPAECPQPSEAFSPARDTFPDIQTAYERMRAVMDEVRGAIGRARVACLSVDATTTPEEDAAISDYRRLGAGPSSSGWARDRMWAQYADGHRGLCLLFDREKLVQEFQETFAGRGMCLSREVEYSDEIPRLPRIDLREATRDPSAYALAYRSAHVHARYFLKRQDWAGEREFRLVLIDDAASVQPAFVPIRRALVAVMVGHRFPRAYLPCIEHVCEEAGIPSFQFRHSSSWSYPRAVPYGLGFPQQ
jgi:hypothetical protein